MRTIKNLFFKLFPKFDTRPIATVYYVDFKARKLVNKQVASLEIRVDKHAA